MRRILVEPSRVRAVCLLHSTGLLAAILPSAASIAENEHWPDDMLAGTKSVAQFSATSAPRMLHVLHELKEPSFPLALAALLHQASNDKLAEMSVALGNFRGLKLIASRGCCKIKTHSSTQNRSAGRSCNHC